MKRILVLGGGFAGLWSAVGAARKLAELASGQAEVVLVDQNPYHNIRVRNYEPDLEQVVVPLDDVLAPIGVQRVEGRVVDIDSGSQAVRVTTAVGDTTLAYDRLVLALGSQLVKPDIPGLREFAFDVDTYASASRLRAHLQSLAKRPASDARNTALVVGAGLTGVEVAAEMPGRLRQALGRDCEPRVLLADLAPVVGSDMGDEARPVIERALRTLGIAHRLGVSVAEIAPDRVALSSGETIATATTVWCAGMAANPLARRIPGEFDKFGRLAVDAYMRVKGVPNMFAAGDIAAAKIDGVRASVMSCQHGRPMGRHAGHNVAADLFGVDLLPLHIPHYVTVVDLGPAGAIYTSGWHRAFAADGATAKQVKETINRQRIYPPRSRDRDDILRAGAPVVQSAPEIPLVQHAKEAADAAVG